MSVYLIQHITNNNTAIDLVVTFYSKLQQIHLKKCINYWIDHKKNSVFYLIKAPNKNSIRKLYHTSINLHPYKITSVNNHLVYAFLKSEQQLKAIQSKSFYKPQKHSVIFLIKTFNKKIFLLNKTKALESLSLKKTIIQNLITSYKGYQIETNEDIIASFHSIKEALNCTASILDKLNKRVDNISTKIILYPFLSNNKENTFTQVIPKLTKLLYLVKKKEQLIVSSRMINMYPSLSNLKSINATKKIYWLNLEKESFILSLIDILSKNYHKPKFKISDICALMMMSKTKLYRNCKDITGKSINQLLKEFRLLKSIDSITMSSSAISQISTDVGFNSSSYFSNCFKKKFGICPKELSKQKNSLNFLYNIQLT
ncbi:helix-turn-helix domain-containing protein [Tenacibaculum sp. SDUM215027]|uniref:helix-turn-helix domain-containing protein n=1 Tax=Tenacibaculum sp. SDUM215027 TaxID=3422596 RepID=UPI003D31F9B6